MKGTYIDIGGNNGDVTGFNKEPLNGESFIVFDQTKDIVKGYGYNHWDKYKVVDGGLTLKSSEEIMAIEISNTKIKNSAAAEYEQNKIISNLENEESRAKRGLPPKINDNDKAIHNEFAKGLQSQIDHPTSDNTYNPPLPPGIVPPSYDSITVVVTRQEGWQGILGWKAVIESASIGFIPSNIALSVHTGAGCEGYKYTTGAFQQDENGDWFATCPPGHEPGDNDEHFGLLYGAAQLSCFTLLKGEQTKIIYAYENT